MITYDVPMTRREIEIVRLMADRYRRAMLFEIARTDSRELREDLRAREDLLEDFIYRLDSFSGEPDELEAVD